eukprot:m.72956 g.72956  ORF g.72956 m.72956 type:complete len:781 (-) comp8406_c0_seq4:1468-3810(-)
MGKVRVCMRLRPRIESDGTTESGGRLHSSLDGMEDDWLQVKGSSVSVYNWKSPSDLLTYKFDHCFPLDCTQEDVFKAEVLPLLNLPFDGINATCFAFGPTGSGKTFTMQGEGDKNGIIPQSITHLIQTSSSISSSDVHIDLTMSYLQVYQEKVFDLLEPKDHDLPVRSDVTGNIVVAGLAEKPFSTFDEFKQMFESGLSHRATSGTKLNAHSSRSHAVLVIKVFQRRKASEGWLQSIGTLNLIDLAGSEDNRKTGNTGARMKESVAINHSLFALNKVVVAINKNLPRIPYRDSKLTRLLMNSLGGNSVTCMITCLNSTKEQYFNTYHALNFASKSRSVVNKPISSHQSIGPDTTSSSTSTSSSLSSHSENPAKKAKHIGATKVSTSIAPKTAQQVRKIQNMAPKRVGKCYKQVVSTTSTMKINKVENLEAKNAALEDRVKQLEEIMKGIMEQKPTITTQGCEKEQEKANKESKVEQELSNIQSHEDKAEQKKAEEITQVETPTQQVNANASSLGERGEQAKAYISRAKACKKEGDLNTALSLYRKAQEFLPQHKGLQTKIAQIEQSLEEEHAKKIAHQNDSTVLPTASLRANTITTKTAATTTKKHGIGSLLSRRNNMSFSNAGLERKKGKICGGASKLQVFDEFEGEVLKTAPHGHHQKRNPLKPVLSLEMAVQGKKRKSESGDPDYVPDGADDFNHEESELCAKKMYKPLATCAFSSDDLLNKLNTASTKELLLLNGIGKKRAQLIVQAREMSGKFENIDEVVSRGVPSSVISRLTVA